MLERFTDRARRITVGAVEIASREGAERVRPEHLLAALLDDDDALAVVVLGELGAPSAELRQVCAGLRHRAPGGLDADDAAALSVLGIDLAEVIHRIETELGAGPRLDPRRARGHLRFAKAAKKVLEHALREAVALGDAFIGSEHVLLGLARGEDPVVSGTLEAFDVTLDDLRTAVSAADRRRTG